MRALIVSLVLVGCTSLTSPAPVAVTLAPPPPVLTVGAPTPGSRVALAVTGAAPRASVSFLFSTVGEGAGPCRRGVCLGLLSPTLLGTVKADASGTARLSVPVPAGAPFGARGWFQASSSNAAGLTLSPVTAVDIGCTWSERFIDADGDGFGQPGTGTLACTAGAPAGTSAASGDCDDTLATSFPGATEACNSVDDDCDGTVDNLGACPCDLDNGGCDANATCEPTGPDTRTCDCNEGYSGDGETCVAEPDPCTVNRCAADLNTGDLIFSEVHDAPDDCAAANAEYLELHNVTDTTIDLTGLAIAVGASVGNLPGGLVAPGSRAVVQFGTASPRCYPVDNLVGTLSGALDHRTQVYRVQVAADARVIDQLDLRSLPAPQRGLSLQLDVGVTTGLGNDSASAWCATPPTAPQQLGTQDYGTPGRENLACTVIEDSGLAP